MDILYSITAHESPECVIDLINNIFYFNKGLIISIIIHTNTYIFNELKDLNIKNVFINPKILDKRYATIDILIGHIQNFTFSEYLNMKFQYFIPLASNCYFHKYLTLDYIKLSLEKSENAIPHRNYDHNGWHWWTSIFQNKKILQILLDNQDCIDLFVNQHEGQIHTYETISYISNIIMKYKIFDIVESQICFEEFMLPTLYAKYTGKKVVDICNVFWNLPNLRPNIEQIESSEKPIVKTVVRDIDDPIRIYFRKKTNNYLHIE